MHLISSQIVHSPVRCKLKTFSNATVSNYRASFVLLHTILLAAKSDIPEILGNSWKCGYFSHLPGSMH